MLIRDGEVELVDEAPAQEEDLLIEADLRSLTQLWLGDLSLRGALTRQLLRLKGKPLLIRCIEDWLPLARQAAVRPARPANQQILPPTQSAAADVETAAAVAKSEVAKAPEKTKTPEKTKAPEKTRAKAKAKASVKKKAKVPAKKKAKAPAKKKTKTRSKKT